MKLIKCIERELEKVVDTKLEYYYDDAHNELKDGITEKVYADFAKWLVNEYRTQDE